MKKGDQPVEQFVEGVPRRVREKTRSMQEQCGDAMRDVAEEAMKEAQSYAESRRKLLKGFDAEDLSSEEADGACDSETKQVAIEKKVAMPMGRTDAEEEAIVKKSTKIRDHELAHRDLQAANSAFKEQEVVLDPAKGEEGEVELLNLKEGQAIEKGGQTHDELPQEYIDHDERYKEVVAVVGKRTVERALKTADLSIVQEKIIEKKHADFVRALTRDAKPKLANAA